MKLLFYKGTKKENPSAQLFDRLICFVTRSRFSHVELSFEERGSYLHRCWSSSIRNDGFGVREKWIDTSTGHWFILETNTSCTEELFFLERYSRYDWVGLLGTLTKKKWFSHPKKWFCSEIVAEALGLKDSWKMTPEDLFQTFTRRHLEKSIY